MNARFLQQIPLLALALVAILLAAGLYADKVYEAPQAPPTILYTLKGPVILYDDANPGEVITAPNLGTIYYLNQDKQRVVFPDEQTFLSWYADFSAVKTIPQEVLESYPLSGRNVTIRPATLLITIPSSPQVWMISTPNNLHWLAGGEEQVVTLFGEDWQDRLVDLPEYYFENYEQANDVLVENAYPTGALIHVQSNDQYYVVTNEGQRFITEEGMQANHFQKQFALEREEPLTFSLSGPSIETYEPQWGSPDLFEQVADKGPDDIEVGGQIPELS